VKRFIKAIAIILGLVSITACQPKAANPLKSYDYSQMKLIQFEPIEQGSPIAIIETDYGTIKIVLYPEEAPNTVENFIYLAEKGFYDNKSIFGIDKEAYFITGSTDAPSGEQQWETKTGELIENEYSVNLWPFRGAVMSFNENQGFFGDSRFFIINQVELTEAEKETLEMNVDEEGNEIVPQYLLDKFIEGKGIFGFSGQYTIFGQTYDGFDVIEKILSLEVVDPEENLKPKEDVKIKSIRISEYGKDS